MRALGVRDFAFWYKKIYSYICFDPITVIKVINPQNHDNQIYRKHIKKKLSLTKYIILIKFGTVSTGKKMNYNNYMNR